MAKKGSDDSTTSATIVGLKRVGSFDKIGREVVDLLPLLALDLLFVRGAFLVGFAG